MGVVAVELLCSRSVRSSFDVVLEPVSMPLSAVGLEMEDAALSEPGRVEEHPLCCSIKGTPPEIDTLG